MHSLLVMRHAKSDWDAPYDRDHERPLNQRGIRSARIMGRVLSAHEMAPDLVISSTAVRARTTAELAIEAGGWGSSLLLEPDLYGTGVRAAIGIIEGATDAGCLMVVGHQPTWSLLVAEITGESVDMKTATVAEIAWLDRSLVRVLQPRDFLGGEFDR